MIGINDYLHVFPGTKDIDIFCETELNEILFNSMPNIWIRQVYVQGFYCETITLKKL